MVLQTLSFVVLPLAPLGVFAPARPGAGILRRSIRDRVEWTMSVVLIASAVKLVTLTSRLKLMVSG